MSENPPALKQTWIRTLHREDIDRLKVVNVCIKHFSEEDIEYFHKVSNGDGTFTSVPRDKLKLDEGTIPCLLPGCPSYYSSLSTSKCSSLSYESKEKEKMDQTIQLSLKSEKCRSLPHVQTLNTLYSPFSIANDFSAYLTQATSSFSSLERNVIVQMDEIHVKSDITYKGRKIVAPNLDQEDPTKTVFALMVSSLHNKWSCISHLLPCGSISTEKIFPIIKECIIDIENCGLHGIGMLEGGLTQKVVASRIGKDIRTVKRWWKRFTSNQSLDHKPGAGGPSLLNPVAKMIIGKSLGKRHQSQED
ncbi:hypothetical protein LOD99_1566 [Oopsacas minuta]|uniref:Transposable element P transposase-like RNase H domain-containing protein n=1 Tax=Oopsacas minuta TaxID=111878 RepID=A0AAV7K4Q8_9METZ|nr:hypothetical protein LOD99_1566 [Oopsacas minuta]